MLLSNSFRTWLAGAVSFIALFGIVASPALAGHDPVVGQKQRTPEAEALVKIINANRENPEQAARDYLALEQEWQRQGKLVDALRKESDRRAARIANSTKQCWQGYAARYTKELRAAKARRLVDEIFVRKGGDPTAVARHCLNLAKDENRTDRRVLLEAAVKVRLRAEQPEFQKAFLIAQATILGHERAALIFSQNSTHPDQFAQAYVAQYYRWLRGGRKGEAEALKHSVQKILKAQSGIPVVGELFRERFHVALGDAEGRLTAAEAQVGKPSELSTALQAVRARLSSTTAPVKASRKALKRSRDGSDDLVSVLSSAQLGNRGGEKYSKSEDADEAGSPIVILNPDAWNIQ